MSEYGPSNPNWRGGRTLASNGYFLVRRPGHPMADVRGYVYEHRLVASEALGRLLDGSEIVHHRNGVKTDNRPENLEVVAGVGEHFVHHRHGDRGLRMPGEDNPEVPCACGCGGTFLRFDIMNRPRRYLPGHNAGERAPERDLVLAAIGAGAVTPTEIARVSGRGLRPTVTLLCKLVKLGTIRRVSHGRYALDGVEHNDRPRVGRPGGAR